MDYVKLQVKNRIGVVTFHRPPVNSLDKKSYLEITDMFESLNERNDISVVLFKTEGKGFIAGNDINDIDKMTRANHHKYQEDIKNCAVAIYNCKFPVVAAVQGYVIGAGLALASMCDVIIASEDAYFMMTEINLGICAGYGFLSMLLPEKIARYMAFTTNRMSAEEMSNYGGVAKVVAKEELYNKAIELCETIANKPPTALQYFKEAININHDVRIAEKFNIENLHTDRMLETPEKEECNRAFFEKRNPKFF